MSKTVRSILEEIQNDYNAYGYVSEEDIDKALQDIKSIIESEVIGEDEYSIDPLWAGKQGYWAKNELRAEQQTNLNKLLGKE